MQISRTDFNNWANHFHDAPYPYLRADFAILNARKAEDLHFLIFKEEKLLSGIILGLKDGSLNAPFSAPFSGFCFSRRPLPEEIYSVAKALARYADTLDLPIKITLPPEIFSEAYPAEAIGALSQAGFSLLYADLSYHIPLPLPAGYPGMLKAKARKAFRIAGNAPLNISHADFNSDPSVLSRAYNMIAANRSHRGFPLKMSLDDLIATAKIVQIDSFVMSYQQQDVAAAIVYRLSDTIAQVIYWGHDYSAPELPYIHQLAKYLADFYSLRNFRVLDIGPASDRGCLQSGLARFKQSIGCVPSAKLTFSYSPHSKNQP